jgi:hypothetical protein
MEMHSLMANYKIGVLTMKVIYSICPQSLRYPLCAVT